MKIFKTKFKSCFIFKPDVYRDKRGVFSEIFNKTMLEKTLRKKINFVQLNYSFSKINVLRGMHLQKPPFSQSKLIRVIQGKILDIVVDLRKNSKTFGKYQSFIISEKNRKQLFIPEGFAHGFLSLENNVKVEYLCSSLFNKNSEICLMWNDKKINIKWPKKKFLISKKDKNGSAFSEIMSMIK